MRVGPFTLVSFHAHPDDEALLTGGTLARTARQGHRVVLVVATDGAAGLTREDWVADLAVRRRGEVERAAAALGVHRVVHLGYADSGMDGQASPDTSFVGRPVEEAAQRLAAVLDEEDADLLTVYDAHGGYGHPDHVRVHHVGVRAAALAARPPVVLEATVDRRPLHRATAVLRRLGPALRPLLRGLELPDLSRAYADPARLTHRVDVRGAWEAKRAALAAHASQAAAEGGSGGRTVGLLLRLPGPLSRRVLGREWFLERGRTPTRPLLDDIFASLR